MSEMDERLARSFVVREYHEQLSLMRAENAQLKEQLAIARGALDYIVSHDWAAEKPKWGNEFVDVARDALARMKGGEG